MLILTNCMIQTRGMRYMKFPNCLYLSIHNFLNSVHLYVVKVRNPSANLAVNPVKRLQLVVPLEVGKGWSGAAAAGKQPPHE